MTERELSILGSEARRMINEYLSKGNSMHKLAKKAGIHSSQLWLYVREKRGLTDTSLEKIGKALSE